MPVENGRLRRALRPIISLTNLAVCSMANSCAYCLVLPSVSRFLLHNVSPKALALLVKADSCPQRLMLRWIMPESHSHKLCTVLVVHWGSCSSCQLTGLKHRSVPPGFRSLPGSRVSPQSEITDLALAIVPEFRGG